MRPFSNVLTLFAIAFCLGLLGGFWALSENLRMLHASKAAQEGEMSLFMDSSLSPEKIAETKIKIQQFSWVQDASIMSSEEALKHLRDKFGESLAANLTETTLPITIRIKMKDKVIDKDLRSAIEDMRGWEGVVDADLGGELWSGELSKSTTSTMASWSNLLLGVVFVVVILLISHITRIAFEGSKDDVETLTLLGASKRWIFAPLLIESAVIGVLGSVMGLCITVLFLKYGLPPLSEILFGKITPIHDLSWVALWKILGLGVFASLVGACLTWPLIAKAGRV